MQRQNEMTALFLGFKAIMESTLVDGSTAAKRIMS